MPTPYLSFDGTCREAFRFYEQALGAKTGDLMPFGESPMGSQVPRELGSRIMHGTIRIQDQVVMGADCGPWSPYEGPMRSCALMLDFKDFNEARAAFDRLADRGTVVAPFQKTFWADGYGQLIDRYGIGWMVNCEPKAA